VSESIHAPSAYVNVPNEPSAWITNGLFRWTIAATSWFAASGVANPGSVIGCVHVVTLAGRIVNENR
jgi:hypothetical protein